MANAGAVHNYRHAVQSAGQLYQAIIPKGAVLADSRAMEGAKRAIYHGAKGIKGQANLLAVDGNMGGGLAAMSVANAAMGVASMVVGQYYMTQINNRLDSVIIIQPNGNSGMHFAKKRIERTTAGERRIIVYSAEIFARL